MRFGRQVVRVTGMGGSSSPAIAQRTHEELLEMRKAQTEGKGTDEATRLGYETHGF